VHTNNINEEEVAYLWYRWQSSVLYVASYHLARSSGIPCAN
jgi:hypothetical protein